VDTGPWPAVRVLVTVEPGAGERAGATLARAAASCRSRRWTGAVLVACVPDV